MEEDPGWVWPPAPPLVAVSQPEQASRRPGVMALQLAEETAVAEAWALWLCGMVDDSGRADDEDRSEEALQRCKY